jgi:FAD/FMN-containing dehydrogenase
MDEKLKSRIREQLGNDAKILGGTFERELYSKDIGEVPFVERLFGTIPDIVIQPKSVEALKKIVKFTNKENVALFPRGSGSSGLGAVVPTVNGIVLDFSSLNKIIELNRKNETLKVQTGVRWSELEDFLQDDQLSVRAYPSSFFSTVGGWIATGGYGIGSFQYGHLKDQVESIEVMFPSGEITSVHSDDEEFSYFFGTEGQFGILLTATLKLRKKPKKLLPYLIYFGSSEAAFTFINDLIHAEITPYHIKYVDAPHLEETNNILGEDLFGAKDALLVAFGNENEEQKFLTFSEKQGILADDYLAHYLWHERLFPMKRKGNKPTPLACELLMPRENAVSYLNRVQWVAKQHGVDVQVESHIVGKNEALVMVTFDSDVRVPRTYRAHLMLIPRLMRLGIKFGGAPYGVGIWNTPFINDKFDQRTLEIYKAYKHKVDPRNILNPNKFFAVKTKWAAIPAILFKPRIFRLLVRIASVLSSVLAQPDSLTKRGKNESLLEETVYSCIKCGSCAAYCPAYNATGDEVLIPKNKLILARKILEGEEIAKCDSDRAFLCMHCGMCRDVCQNDLDLLTAWSELERNLEDRFGKPVDTIQDFVSRLESNEKYWKFVHAQKV